MTNSSSKRRIVALVLAAGSGQRVGDSCPKQFLAYGGTTILHHTIRAFEPFVDDVLVVCQDEWRAAAAPHATCLGGSTGYESLQRGLEALAVREDPDTLVMIHDAVRPLVSDEVIADNIAVARREGNAIAAVPVYETLFSAPSAPGPVRDMVRRDAMFRAQTPQTFTLRDLLEMMAKAHALAIGDAESACTLAHQLGYPLHLSKGDFRNFKITTPADLKLYEELISGK